MEKVAYIEISNYFAKLIIANVKENTFFNTIIRRIVPITLGVDLDKDHFLKRGNIEETIDTLKQFRKTIDMYNVDKTVCISTFLNEIKPKNITSFCDEIYTKCGFRLDIKDNEEHFKYMYNSCAYSSEAAKGLAFLLELDSIRIIQYNRRGIINSLAFPFGALSLTDSFPKEQFATDAERQDFIDSYIDSELKRIDFVDDTEEVNMIGIGRQVDDLARMIKKHIKYPFELVHNFVMTYENVCYINEQLKEIGLDSTKKIKGMDEGRADIFVLAVRIVKKLMEKFNKEQLSVCKNGVLEGAILNDIIVPPTEKPFLDMNEMSLRGCAINYNERQEEHAKQVQRLAEMIFKELRVSHRLTKPYLRALKTAAYLHDIGYNVDYFSHSMHSYYIIMNKEIYGLSHREQIMAAFIASMHHGETIDLPNWIKYSSILEPDDIEAVKKLGSILQLSECFDLSMSNVIKELYCDILGDSVIFRTVANPEKDKTFEIEEAKKMIKYFNKYYNRRLDIL